MTGIRNLACFVGAAAALGAIAFAAAARANELGLGKSVAGGAASFAANGQDVAIFGDVHALLAAVPASAEEGGDWLSRVRGGYDYHSDGANRIWLETIQPLALTERHTVFWQARVSHAHDDETLNAGLGYRWLSPDENWLLGANGFFDYSVEAKHRRASLGLEAIGPFVSLRGNLYQAISNWRPLGAGVREHALDGADAAIDAQAPYMPWLRVGARYFEWRGIDGPDARGVQGTMSADIADEVQLVGSYAGSDDPEGRYYIGVRLRLAGGSRPTALKEFWSSKFMTARNLSAHRLEFVERENRIITESQGGPYASGTITVSRSE